MYLLGYLRLRRKMNVLACILWESTHDTLQRPPNIRRRVWCRVGGQAAVPVRERSTRLYGSVRWAGVVGERDGIAACRIDVSTDRIGVRKANLSWFVDVDHVADVTPRVLVEDHVLVVVDGTWSILGEEANLSRRTS